MTYPPAWPSTPPWTASPCLPECVPWPLKSKGVAIFRVVSGNFLEMYDFMVYGFYATAIAKTFFPGDNPFASLMLSLATFGAGS